MFYKLLCVQVTTVRSMEEQRNRIPNSVSIFWCGIDYANVSLQGFRSATVKVRQALSGLLKQIAGELLANPFSAFKKFLKWVITGYSSPLYVHLFY